jgi:hypothetical protein
MTSEQNNLFKRFQRGLVSLLVLPFLAVSLGCSPKVENLPFQGFSFDSSRGGCVLCFDKHPEESRPYFGCRKRVHAPCDVVDDLTIGNVYKITSEYSSVMPYPELKSVEEVK